MKIFNWAIIGPGSIAQSFALTLAECDGAQLYAVSSRSQKRAEVFAKKYDVPHAYEGVSTMCADSNIDIVYISDVNSAHKSSVIACLNAGKHVLCEKPIAMNKKDLEEMITCAQDNNRFLMEATWTLFLPTMLKVRQWIAQGRIGEIRRISADFGFHMDSKTGRVFDYSLGGGALLDLGPYSIGVPYVLLNKTPVSITSNMHIGQTGVDEVDNVILGYEDGICIQGFCSITTSVPSDMHIQGTRGRIFMPSFFTAEKAELYIDGKLEDSFAKQNNGLGFMYEINETMQCIREGKLESDIIPLSTSLAIMEIIDEVRKQGSLIYDND